jgi:hypothetical protein
MGGLRFLQGEYVAPSNGCQRMDPGGLVRRRTCRTPGCGFAGSFGSVSDWPPTDRAGVYTLPRQMHEPPTIETQLARLATHRLSQGLPVSGEILEEVLELQQTRDGIETRAEHAERERTSALVDEVRGTLMSSNAGPVLGSVERCWIDGRGGVRVRLTAQLDRYRALLEKQFGPDRIRVEPATFAQAHGTAMQMRLRGDAEILTQHGIRLSRFGTGRDGFQIAFYAWDQQEAEHFLRDRYGTGLILEYQGASSRTFRAFSFASWLAEGDLLHVFYALAHNGERPGSCLAWEDERSVVVALSIKDSRGPKHLVGGFTPSHATVQLERPLQDRVVIDDSANRVRPHWSEAPELLTGYRGGR